MCAYICVRAYVSRRERADTSKEVPVRGGSSKGAHIYTAAPRSITPPHGTNTSRYIGLHAWHTHKHARTHPHPHHTGSLCGRARLGDSIDVYVSVHDCDSGGVHTHHTRTHTRTRTPTSTHSHVPANPRTLTHSHSHNLGGTHTHTRTHPPR